MGEQLGMLEQTFEGAIKDLVEACGGWKKIGKELRSDLDPEHAARWMQKSLQPNRREVMPYSDVRKLLRIGRRHRCNVLMDFLASDSGYEPPQPLDLVKEAEVVGKDVDRMMASIGARIERFNRMHALIDGRHSD